MEFHIDIESHIGPPKEVTDEIIQACREKGQFGARLGAVGQVAARIGGGCLPSDATACAGVFASVVERTWGGTRRGHQSPFDLDEYLPGEPRAVQRARSKTPLAHICGVLLLPGKMGLLHKWDFSIKLRRSLAETTVSAAEYTGM